MEHSVQDPRQATEFVQLLTSHQRRLYVYIMTFLPHLADADEVLQETNVVLWSKAHEFILGTSFSDWAYKIAYFQVLAFRKRGVRSRLVFAQDMKSRRSPTKSSRSTRGTAIGSKHWPAACRNCPTATAI